MAGALQKLRSGELSKLCRDISVQREALARHALTAGYASVLAVCADDLDRALTPIVDPIDAVTRDEIERKLAALGATFDDSARALDALLTALALARPARASVCEAARQALFPEGMQLINTSHSNEAGVAPRLRDVLESPSEVRALWTDVQIDGEPLGAWLERLVAAAEGLGVELAKLPPSQDGQRRARRNAIAAARGRAIRALHQLADAATFAGWRGAERQAALGQLDRLLARKNAR